MPPAGSDNQQGSGCWHRVAEWFHGVGLCLQQQDKRYLCQRQYTENKGERLQGPTHWTDVRLRRLPAWFYLHVAQATKLQLPYLWVQLAPRLSATDKNDPHCRRPRPLVAFAARTQNLQLIAIVGSFAGAAARRRLKLNGTLWRLLWQTEKFPFTGHFEDRSRESQLNRLQIMCTAEKVVWPILSRGKWPIVRLHLL